MKGMTRLIGMILVVALLAGCKTTPLETTRGRVYYYLVKSGAAPILLVTRNPRGRELIMSGTREECLQEMAKERDRMTGKESAFTVTRGKEKPVEVVYDLEADEYLLDLSGKR